MFFLDLSFFWNTLVLQAEEEMARELQRLEREESARCALCEAVVEASQLDLQSADLGRLRQVRR